MKVETVAMLSLILAALSFAVERALRVLERRRENMEKVLSAVTQALYLSSDTEQAISDVYAILYLHVDKETRDLVEDMGPRGMVGLKSWEKDRHRRQVAGRIAKRLWKRSYPLRRKFKSAPEYRALRSINSQSRDETEADDGATA